MHPRLNVQAPVSATSLSDEEDYLAQVSMLAQMSTDDIRKTIRSWSPARLERFVRLSHAFRVPSQDGAVLVLAIVREYYNRLRG